MELRLPCWSGQFYTTFKRISSFCRANSTAWRPTIWEIGLTRGRRESTEGGSQRVPGTKAMPPVEGAFKLPNGQMGDASRHEHRSVRADERVWLEAIHEEAATMRLHAYCADCGAVRSRRPMRGRPMGYFQQALANLMTSLEDHPRYPKLAQVHRHLIGKTFESIPEFADPYSMDFETQRKIFMDSVRRYRPELPIDLLEEVLPREPRAKRKAYIDLIAPVEKEASEAVSPR